MKIKSTAMSLALVSALSLPATATENEENPVAEPETVFEWVLETPQRIAVEREIGTEVDFFADRQILSLQTDPTTKIILTCQIIRDGDEIEDARLNVGFDLDTTKNPANSVRNLRSVVAKVAINGKEKPYTHRWNVATDIIAPNNRALARRIFNAGVRGDALTVTVSNEKRIDVTLPKMNDAFRTFAKGCPVTNGSQ